MGILEVPRNDRDFEDKSENDEVAQEDNVEEAVRDLSVQVDQLHSQLLDLEEEYGRIYEQLQDLVDSNREFTQALKEELELDIDVSDEDHETKPDDNVSVA